MSSIPIPSRYLSVLETLIDMSRDQMQTNGAVPTYAIMVKFDENGNVIAPIGGLGHLPPWLAMAALRMILKKEQPDFVVAVAEVWSTHAETREDAERLVKQSKGSIEDLPGTESAVYFALDSYEGAWTGFAKREGDEGHYTFGKVAIHPAQSNSMFLGLLPPRSTDTMQ